MKRTPILLVAAILVPLAYGAVVWLAVHFLNGVLPFRLTIFFPAALVPAFVWWAFLLRIRRFALKGGERVVLQATGVSNSADAATLTVTTRRVFCELEWRVILARNLREERRWQFALGDLVAISHGVREFEFEKRFQQVPVLLLATAREEHWFAAHYAGIESISEAISRLTGLEPTTEMPPAGATAEEFRENL